eukprot:124812_1
MALVKAHGRGVMQIMLSILFASLWTAVMLNETNQSKIKQNETVSATMRNETNETRNSGNPLPSPPYNASPAQHIFDVWLIATVGFNSSYLLIPYFIEWYTSIGIKPTHFLLSINIDATTDDMVQLRQLTDYLGRMNVTNYTLWTERYSSPKRKKVNQKLMKSIPSSHYILLTDVDEFQDWKHFGINDIYNFIEHQMIEKDYEYVMGYLQDRFAENATLVNPIATRYSASNVSVSKLWEQYPFACDFTKNILQAWISKVCLFKNVYDYHKGHHFLARRYIPYHGHRVRFHAFPDEGDTRQIHQRKGDSALRYKPFVIPIHHFKWNKNVLRYLQRRAMYYKQLGFKWWEQSKWGSDWLQNNSGNVNLGELKTFNCSRVR